jgi:glycosyltransferase involved in cell wall biosynthesis
MVGRVLALRACTAPDPITSKQAGAGMNVEKRHAIGICTFRRPSLADTLASLADQTAPVGQLTLIVADNDDSPTGQALVMDFARRSQHQVVYIHAPARNISVARNAILSAARSRGLQFLAFIDDDELASAGWYRCLFSALVTSQADLAVGPVRAVYAPDAPDWMTRARSHDTTPEIDADGRPIAGHSCNVMIDLKSPAFDNLHFCADRGRTGGEDTAFFDAAKHQGAVFALAPDAEVTEAVSPDRAQLRWLLRRRYRMGQTHGSLLAVNGGQGRLRRGVVSAAKLGWCVSAAILTMPMPSRRNASLVRGALHAGVLADSIGLDRVEIYGAPAGKFEKGQRGS